MKIPELFKGDKKSKIGIYILLTAGIILLALGSLPKKEAPAEPEAAPAETDYIERLEERLEAALSSIDGAGEVRVTLVPRDRGSVDVGRDGGGDGSKTVILSGQSGSRPLVLAELYPEIRGAVIVASGAGSDRVRADLTEAAATALGVGAHKVKVYKMRDR